MNAILFTWWFWFAIALVFGILEILAPVFVFLGLAAGAAVIGILLSLGIDFGGSMPPLLVIFAVVSLAVSLVLRRYLVMARGQVRVVEKDIND